MKKYWLAIMAVLALSLTAQAEEPYLEIHFAFKPDNNEKAILTDKNLLAILPNFPSRAIRKEVPEYDVLTVWRAPNILYGIKCYFVHYVQGEECNHSDYGGTYCMLAIKNNKLSFLYKFKGFMDVPTGDPQFIDFDNDKYNDIFLSYGYEGYISHYALYRNVKGSFPRDVIDFTNNISEDEFLPTSEDYRQFKLVDIDKDKKYELVVETDKFKRIYKWNGEVFVLQSKTPVKTDK